jgi:hypothetical protein
MPGKTKRRLDHERPDRVELLGRELGYRRDVLEPGVVDEDVDLVRQVGVHIRVGEIRRDRVAVER